MNGTRTIPGPRQPRSSKAQTARRRGAQAHRQGTGKRAPVARCPRHKLPEHACQKMRRGLKLQALEALPATQRTSANSFGFGTSAYHREAGANAAPPSTEKAVESKMGAVAWGLEFPLGRDL